MRRRATGAVMMTAAILMVVETVVAGMAGAAGDNVAAARQGTARYHRLEVATAEGYGELADLAGLTCIEDAGGDGAMGVHYVNGALVGDGVIDESRPEALLYDTTGPRAKLLGVEYVVFLADWGQHRAAPQLFGQEFELVSSPNRYGLPPFYELHVWLWEHNPAGAFADWNPRITCGTASR